MRKGRITQARKDFLIAIVLMIIVTFLISAGQLLIKKGVSEISDFYSLLNLSLLAGFFIYFIALVVMLIALKKGEVSVLYPIMALSYIWILFLSFIFLGEQMNNLKIIGTIIIFVGVSLIGMGGR